MNIAFAGFRHNHIMALYNMALKAEDVNITGCFEEDNAARECAAKDWGISFTYDSYEELLNDEGVEAVAIGDYFQKRGSMVIAALKKGKHVICDKPICTDLAELDEISRLSEENNLQVSCMLELRYMSQVHKVKELVQSGAVGDLKIISFTGQHCLNYGTRPGWYFEEGKHGGTINDIAIHGVDLVWFITGKKLTKVDFAKTWNGFALKEPEFEDCGQFSVVMEDVQVMGDVSYAAPAFKGTLPTYWDFYFWGTRGMIHFNLKEQNIIHLYGETEEIIECEKISENYLDHFIREIKGISTMLNTESVLEGQRQVLMIQKAASSHIEFGA